jgi:hypothetical protein
VNLRTHRWWLAAVGALSTPWFGPHITDYIPVGWALLRVGSGDPDAAFWILAAILLLVGYGVWLLILTLVAGRFGGGVKRSS